MKHIQPDTHHFFASSASTWMTTTDKRGLHDVLAAMEKEGKTFNLFLVPLPWDAVYEIGMYRPVVEGAEWLGGFTFGEEN